jgi:hypothetical protein
MAKTRRTRYWQASERDHRRASNREANILSDIDRYARDLRFIRTPQHRRCTTSGISPKPETISGQHLQLLAPRLHQLRQNRRSDCPKEWRLQNVSTTEQASRCLRPNYQGLSQLDRLDPWRSQPHERSSEGLLMTRHHYDSS